MKKLICILIISLALAALALPPVVVGANLINLISNPGFEQGEVGWKSFKPEGSYALMRICNNFPASAHSGSGFATIWPIQANEVSGYYGYYQKIPNPIPNQPWRISGWMGTSPVDWQGNPQGWIQAEFYDNIKGGLDHRIWEADIYTPRLSKVLKGYRYFESPIRYVPYNAKLAQVVFLVWCPGAYDSGLFAFDDLKLEVIPEPLTIILFGGGIMGLLAFARKKAKIKK